MSVPKKEGCGINPYLLAFSLYSLMILPLRLHFRLTLAKESSYFIRLEAVGLPVPGLRRAGRKNASEQESPHEKAHALSEINLKWLGCLTEKAVFRKICRMGRLSLLRLDLHLCFTDAAATALIFSFCRTLLMILEKTGALPEAFTAGLHADFHSGETALSLEGIITVRLGKLMGTFLSLGKAYLRSIGRSARNAAKELPAE